MQLFFFFFLDQPFHYSPPDFCSNPHNCYSFSCFPPFSFFSRVTFFSPDLILGLQLATWPARPLTNSAKHSILADTLVPPDCLGFIIKTITVPFLSSLGRLNTFWAQDFLCQCFLSSLPYVAASNTFSTFCSCLCYCLSDSQNISNFSSAIHLWAPQRTT